MAFVAWFELSAYLAEVQSKQAMAAMSALAQPTRLAAYKALLAAGPDGMHSGELAERVGASTASMSTHLAILARAGLIDQERLGRNVVCRAVPGSAEALAAFVGDLG